GPSPRGNFQAFAYQLSEYRRRERCRSYLPRPVGRKPHRPPSGRSRKTRERGHCRDKASDRRCPQGRGELRALDGGRDVVRSLCGKSRGGGRRSAAGRDVEQYGLDPKATLEEINHMGRGILLWLLGVPIPIIIL